MNVHFKNKRTPWWVWIVAGHLCLLTVTGLGILDPDWPYLWRLRLTMRLTHEMNLGAWWSGICLLAVGLISFQLSSTKKTEFRRSWLALALIATGLSLDEIGSLHERLLGNKVIFYGTVAFGILVILPILRNFVKNPATRKTGIQICIAFALFVLVAAQERLEHYIDWSLFPIWTSAIRAMLEEGTELVGILLLFTAVVSQLDDDKQRSFQILVADLRYAPRLMTIVFACLFLNLAACLFVLPSLADIPRRGNPGVWYPVAINFLLFCTTFWIRKTNRTERVVWQIVSGAFLISSATVMVDWLMLLPGYQQFLNDIAKRILTLYIWQGLLIFWLLRAKYIDVRRCAITLASALVLITLNLSFSDHENFLLIFYSIFLTILSSVIFSTIRGAPLVIASAGN